MTKAQDFLDSKIGDFHSFYHPRGDSSKPLIHDDDCKFCNYEDRVVVAMEEYARLKSQEDNENLVSALRKAVTIIEGLEMYTKGVTATPSTMAEIEAELSKHTKG